MRRTDRLKSPLSIGETLHKSRNPILAEVMDRYRALTPLNTAWTRSIAQPLCRHARPVALKNGTLTVHADSSVWASVLRNTEQSVVAGLRNSGLTEIRALHIRVSPSPTPQNNPSADRNAGHHSKLRRLFAQLRKALD
jgi:hypothetical protein